MIDGKTVNLQSNYKARSVKYFIIFIFCWNYRRHFK